MSTYAYLEVTCENCGKIICIRLATKEMGSRVHEDFQLGHLGWNVDHDLCPDCKYLKVEDV
jgi:hypothetical protein